MADQRPLVFEQTLFIAAPASRVWQALVTPAEVARYYLCPLQLLEPRVDGRVVYGTLDQAFITGQVVAIEPGRRLVHTFAFDPQANVGVNSDAVSRVTYTLTPMGEMCQLTLTHDGFGADHQTYANISSGGPTILSGLKTWVETGKPLPWPDAHD